MLRRASRGVLATIAHDHKQLSNGWSCASMVVPACDLDGSPILLISDLADHTRHIKADSRVSLLVTEADLIRSDNTDAAIQTDTARLTVFGHAYRVTNTDDVNRVRQRYLQTHPEAGQYASFGDFAFYRIDIEAVYWVGGFGKQRRLAGDKFIPADITALMAAHDGIVAHMNADHIDALCDIVGHFTTADPQAGWRMQSIDCDGMVLVTSSSDIAPLRIDFPTPTETPAEARNILVEMCKISRA
jgi:putative heme iron utilization protein